MTENEQLEMIGIINRAKANEIHYRRKVQNQRGIINGLQKKVSRLQAEIENLKYLLDKEEEKYTICAKRFYKEGIKEFAERLKEKLIERSIVYVTIDNLLKEMVGE